MMDDVPLPSGIFRPSVVNKRAHLERMHHDKLQSKQAILVEVEGEPQVLELSKLGKLPSLRGVLLDQVMAGEPGQDPLLLKIRERFDRAGVPINDVTVRWRNMTITGLVEIKVHKSPLLKDQLKSALKALKTSVTRRPSGMVREITVLDSVSGELKPGRFTVLLGPPGSGKSCLMKALSGQVKKDSTLKMSCDELTYNGLPLGKFVVERTAAYISQVDQHFGELTVRETLDFSARCQTSRTRKSGLQKLEEREKELGIKPDPALAAYFQAANKAGKQNLVTDLMLRTLGLDICAESLVGNAMLRGISGGQKKRVTTGEMLVGPMKVLFADEISTGLDSATTYDICKALQEACHIMQGTMLVSLLQPAPETFDLFDDVMVISSGKLVFHGPREYVLPFYNSLGFACPKMKGTADFLQQVNTLQDQERFWTDDIDDYRYIPAHEIAATFYSGGPGAEMMKELEQPVNPEKVSHAELATHTYGQGWPTLFRANLRRQAMLQLRNAPFLIISVFQQILLAFAMVTVFLNTPKETLSDAQAYLGICFFSVLIHLVAAFPVSDMFLARLQVYYKQRDAHFYPGWCFALPELILQLPLFFVNSWIWTLMVYFMSGFYSSARVLVFWAFLFITNIWSLSWNMSLAALSRTPPVAIALQASTMLIFMSASGFIANPSTMPAGWLGAYYANPIAAYIKGLAINEMTSPDWSSLGPEGNHTIGNMALDSRGYPSQYKLVWVGLFAWGLGSTAINCLVFTLACTFLSASTKTVHGGI